MVIMDSSLNQLVTLVSVCGETLEVSKNLLEESSAYIQQVLSNSKSTVLLFPDVQFEDLKDLVDHIQFGTELKYDLQVVGSKYGFKSENVNTAETHLPLKKRSREITPPSSPDGHDLVIDENLSPSIKSESSHPESSLASFLPWPLLLQQAAMQKMYAPNLIEEQTNPFVSNFPSYSPPTTYSGIQKTQESDSTPSVGSEELINCEECGKKFRASNLLLHRRRVHRLLQEPVKCCGQEFPTRWHLSQHRKSGDHLPTLWKTGDFKESMTTKC